MRRTAVLTLGLLALLPGIARAQGAPSPATPPSPGSAAPAPDAAPAPAPPAASAAPTVRLGLEDSVRAALARSPETRQAVAELEGFRGKQLQALGIGRPQ